MRKVLLSLFIIFAMIMTSCSLSSAGVGAAIIDHNDSIDKQVLDSIKVLDDKVIDGMKNNNSDEILGIGSEEFKSKASNINELLANNNGVFKDQSFEYKDRYYCKVKSIGKYDVTVSDSKDGLFYITVEAVSKDIFVSLLKSTSNKDDILITSIYIKENNEWKLQTLYFGNYSYDGMNAIDLYEKAKLLESQGSTVSADIYMELCNKVLRPAPFIQYKKESEITDYGKKLNQSLNENYTFPERLKDSNVEMYGFRVEYTKDVGIVPVVRYVTSIELDKKDSLEKEANDMNKEVTDKYQGLKENFKYVLYEAYSEPPTDPKKTYHDYRTGVEQK